MCLQFRIEPICLPFKVSPSGNLNKPFPKIISQQSSKITSYNFPNWCQLDFPITDLTFRKKLWNVPTTGSLQCSRTWDLDFSFGWNRGENSLIGKVCCGFSPLTSEGLAEFNFYTQGHIAKMLTSSYQNSRLWTPLPLFSHLDQQLLEAMIKNSIQQN